MTLLTNIIFSMAITLFPIQTWEELRLEAIDDCLSGVSSQERKRRIKIIDDLIQVEKDFFEKNADIPSIIKGALLSAACSESRFNPKAKGDWGYRKDGSKYPRAIGIVQLWPWWEKSYNVDRQDHIESGRLWLERIRKQYLKIIKRKQCPKSFSNKQKWIVAWVQTTRGAPVNKSNQYRCKQKPLHLKRLKKWIKKIKNKREYQPTGC